MSVDNHAPETVFDQNWKFSYILEVTTVTCDLDLFLLVGTQKMSFADGRR